MKVSIRLIGDKEFVYSIANRLNLNFNLHWTEYPVYVDKERKTIIEGKVMLYATAYKRKLKVSKSVDISLLNFL